MRSLRPLLAGVVAIAAVATVARPAAAQGPDVPGKRVLRLNPPLQFDEMGVEQGLPNSWITSMAQDSLGFLWFGTQGGAARFDGQSMRLFQPEPGVAGRIGSAFVTGLAAADGGVVWIATGDAGLYRYDSDTDALTALRASIDEPRALLSDGVTALLRDSKGRLWVGAGGVLHRLDADGQSFERMPLADDDDDGDPEEITALAESKDGSLWVATRSGAYRVDRESGEVLDHFRKASGDEPSLPSDTVLAILEDRAGVVWLGLDIGLVRRESDGRFTLLTRRTEGALRLPDDRVNALFEGRDGSLWIGTENGLAHVSPDRKSGQHFVNDPAFPDETRTYPKATFGMFQDRAGVLWVATKNGVLKFSQLRRQFRKFKMSGVTGEPLSFAGGTDGILWVGTYGAGLQRVDEARGTVELYSSLGTRGSADFVDLTREIYAMALDPAGTLWLVRDGLGLVRFDTRRGGHEVFEFDPDGEEGPPGERINAIALVGDVLWLATWGGGVVRFDPARREFTQFAGAGPEGLAGDHYYTVQPDRSAPGVLWLGTARAGLERFDTVAGKAQRFVIAGRGAEVAPGADVSVHHLYQAASGVLWLATDGEGLVRFEPTSGKASPVAATVGRMPRVIYAVLPDSKGRLWLPTDGRGLGAFEIDSGRLVMFGPADGASSEFNLSGAYQAPSGQLVLAGANDGYLRFDPATIAPDPYAPPVAITGFSIFGRPAELARPIWTLPTIELGFRQSAVAFEFAALSYASPGVRYRYKLEGVDSDWTETSRGSASYTNLAGGDFTFRVQAANHHGVWNEEGAAVTIAMAVAPWKTWWAFTAYGGLLLGVALGFVRYQSRRVENVRRALRLEAAERELELTGAVQEGFLPQSNRIDSAPYQLIGYYRPADRASGDWWWFEGGQDGAPLIVSCGDVTGHGAGPAMVTAAAATAFRLGERHRTPISRRLDDLNEVVRQVGAGRYQMTMSTVELDGATGKFLFHSAGGLPVMVTSRGGRPKLYPCRGTPLGTAEFMAGTIEGTMKPGDRMLVFTDGIPEVSNASKKQLGMRRMSKIIEDTAVLPLDQAVATLVAEAEKYMGGQPQDDDWTFAMIELAARR
jgi:ligand-binding sensor domain-containing protein/serine phosphatase RsbU (regulator of sigma subunit)